MAKTKVLKKPKLFGVSVLAERVIPKQTKPKVIPKMKRKMTTKHLIKSQVNLQMKEKFKAGQFKKTKRTPKTIATKAGGKFTRLRKFKEKGKRVI